MNINLKEVNARKFKKQQTAMGNKLYTTGAKRMLLKVLYILRFDEDYRFKTRLLAFLKKFGDAHGRINELSKDRVLASVFVKEIEESGVSLGGIFDDLIEFEEVEYELDKDKNFGKR